MNNELITIIEDKEYTKCFIITINRYPDYPVRCDLFISDNISVELDTLEKMISGTTAINKIFLYNIKYESLLASFGIFLYNNLTINIDHSTNNIQACLVLTDGDDDIVNSSELTKEEGIELVNKLLDLNEMIKRGEI